MKILHYSLGFPPYRTGGLTKFCIDLMSQQRKSGDEVALLWPGCMTFLEAKVLIKNRGVVKVNGTDIISYEMINPLPISYDEGIIEIEAFTARADTFAFKDILDEFKPDVVHIHTLMGLYKEFVECVKKRGIHLVFTTHDLFPICPKVTMFREGNVCSTVSNCEYCSTCNTSALNISKIKILQSPIYRILKNSFLVKKIRKRHRDRYLSENIKHIDNCSKRMAKDYIILRDYYYSMLKMMNIIHYNSTVTKRVYEKYFDLPTSCVIGISHSDIKDKKNLKIFDKKNLRIRFLGPMGKAKGFFLLKVALDKLWTERKNFQLDIHFTPEEMSPYMKIHGGYNYCELETIFEETDILVAPSILYETFGYTVLEALSYGVPVIISGTVGAKDILVEGAGIVINEISSEKLYEILKKITVQKLQDMNKIIVEKQSIISIEDMSKQIRTKCYDYKNNDMKKYEI